MIALAAGDYRLEIDPGRGGSILAFDWRGEEVMRRTCGAGILDVACFPLVPFSNRIANGRFHTPAGPVVISPNFPNSDHPHPLHGFGWLASWDVAEVGHDRCVIEHRNEAGEWPWSYAARQTLMLDEQGLTLSVSLSNESSTAMPAGLGIHPYFPRDGDTILRSLHRGEWKTGHDGLPKSLENRSSAIDWWHGAPVAHRVVDTVYADREGALCIDWPALGRRLTMIPSPELTHTVVFVPDGEDYFCVEPVSHATDAINFGSMTTLLPGSILAAQVRFEMSIAP